MRGSLQDIDPRVRFVRTMRRQPTTPRDVLQLPFALTRRCTKCGKTKSDDDFHHDKTTKFGRTARCSDCRNERDRFRYHHPEQCEPRPPPAVRLTPPQLHLFHRHDEDPMQAAHPLQIYGWCPYCRESSGGPTCPSCDCTVHEVRTTGARGDGDMPPHAVELEVSTQINRSRGRYFIRLLLGTSVTLSETFDDDEIEVAERRVGSVLIPVSNSNTRKSLHLLAVRMWRRRHGGGGRRV